MTDEEAIAEVTNNGAFNSSWIAIKGTPDNKKVAELIASDHHVKCAHGETMSVIECNPDVEHKYTWSDEGLEAACEELSDRLPFRVTLANFEY